MQIGCRLSVMTLANTCLYVALGWADSSSAAGTVRALCGTLVTATTGGPDDLFLLYSSRIKYEGDSVYKDAGELEVY